MNKLKKLIFGIVLGFIFCSNVLAEIYTIDKVVEEFDNTNLATSLKEWEMPISVTKDDENKKIIFKSNDETISTFNYTDEYIEFDNRDVVVNEDNYTDSIATMFCFEGIIESLFNLSGHKNKRLSGEMENNIKNEELGIELETQEYEFNNEEEGWNASGDYIKYIKLSLDSEKIAKLAETYGEEISEEDSSTFENTIPTIKIGEVTANSITIHAIVSEYNEENSEEIPYCGIYRATEIDEEYELISDLHVACQDSVGITDDELESEKTYYYKAKVLGGTNFSEIVSATTLKQSSATNPVQSTDKSKEEFTNPKTGNNYIFVVIIFLISSIVSFVLTYQKNIVTND